MKQPKFKFGDKVKTTTGLIFAVEEVKYTYIADEYLYFVPNDRNNSYWTEDKLKLHNEILLTRDLLMKAWWYANDNVTWRNAEESHKINKLMEFFNFKPIGKE